MEKASSEAKQFKRYKTELQRNLDTILKFISIIIVPLGSILFAKQYWISGSTYEQAALDTVAAVLGMIPEGLVLLTSVALAHLVPFVWRDEAHLFVSCLVSKLWRV